MQRKRKILDGVEIEIIFSKRSTLNYGSKNMSNAFLTRETDDVCSFKGNLQQFSHGYDSVTNGYLQQMKLTYSKLFSRTRDTTFLERKCKKYGKCIISSKNCGVTYN